MGNPRYANNGVQRSGRPWRRLRDRIVRRDNGICHRCRKPGADSADHLPPASAGGTNDPSNLAAVHHNVAPYCNRIRSDGTIESARQKLALRVKRLPAPITSRNW